MSASKQDEVTQLLVRWSEGDTGAIEKLTPLVYDELRRLAHKYIKREREGHTLQTTALVHEAYVRLVEQKSVHWQNRAHFFAVSAKVMRRILVDYARKSGSAKRGGGAQKVTLDEGAIISRGRASELVALDEALQGLGEIHPRRNKVVELRYFGGMNNREAAEVLKISEASIERDWRFAKAWLYRELQQQ
ncbi:MAG: sigma-70 family RNA polymerase sigma factor [Acidobacteria bacterium]|nr:sigma-70 family RNA polymerase sigma factor [Acidobacteriota bacterium]